jgi:hypothetical protein
LNALEAAGGAGLNLVFTVGADREILIPVYEQEMVSDNSKWVDRSFSPPVDGLPRLTLTSSDLVEGHAMKS